MTVAQIVMRLIETERGLDRAIAAPRVHRQWLPDEIRNEPGLPEVTSRSLEGHELRLEGSIGRANCIELDPTDRSVRAVADVARYGGKAGAY